MGLCNLVHHLPVSPAQCAWTIPLNVRWELASCAYLYVSTQPTEALGFASNLFVCANLAQTLWAIAFTYEQLGLSCVFLFVIVACLIGAVEEMKGCSSTERLFVALPLSLHAGWTTVAALLNVNLVLVQRMAMAATQLATAFATVYAACFAGILALTLRGNKLYVAAIAWALVAIYFELPANKAMPQLDPVARQALRMSCIAIAGVLIHMSLSAALFEYFFEKLE